MTVAQVPSSMDVTIYMAAPANGEAFDKPARMSNSKHNY